jgi:hypothetical protein
MKNHCVEMIAGREWKMTFPGLERTSSVPVPDCGFHPEMNVRSDLILAF